MSKSFKFRFQKVLDARERQQQALEIEMGRVNGWLLAREEELTSWLRQMADTLDEVGRARRKGDLADNARCAAYLAHVRRRIRQTHRAIAELKARKERVRQELVEAMQACKVLENYRDRLEAEFAADAEKAEERTVEMHSVRQYLRAEGAQ